jgi:alcohol dehydrogenase
MKLKFNAKAELVVSEDLDHDARSLAAALGARKIALVVDRNLLPLAEVKRLSESLKAQTQTVVYPIESLEPTTDIVNQHTAALREEQVDLFVGLGGGSVLDLTKALSVMVVNAGKVEDYHGTGKPFSAGVKKILIPTTAGTGAEVTPGAVLVNTATNFKRSIGGAFVIADYALLHAPLTLSLPDELTASTGMDAIGHCVESYSARCANVVTRMYAKQAFALIYNGLRALFQGRTRDLALREQLLLGSSLAGYAIYNSNTGAAHSISYALGIYHEVPHAVAIARLLPPVVKINVERGCTLYADLYRLIDGADTAGDDRALAHSFSAALGSYAPLSKIKKTLGDYGVNQGNADFLAERGLDLAPALSNNPVDFGLAESKAVLRSLI